MYRLITTVFLLASLTAAVCSAQSNPFVGRWDFNIKTPGGQRASWLGITEKSGSLDVWYQPTGGNVYQVKNVKLEGSHLRLALSPATANRPGMSWELEATGGTLTGTQKRGGETINLIGVRSPELNRSAPKAWAKAEHLFNGKNLAGWEPIGDTANNHWVVKDGLLVNEAHGANLKTTRTFDDFQLHFEVNCPDLANSGFYLRGRYELQLEYEPAGREPHEREMGSIYGRIAPSVQLPRMTGQWETFDVTLVGRTVTVVRNGVTTIEAKQIDGITGGALDANEGEPGSFYIQGDHTGGLKFRNITVAVPKP
ncbi:MAG: DUF1080 domain-containing protein [Acidobacteriota bacterium]|nr:DUF1080 domain-containing protein [Acidobacteriota bacterium]